VRTGAARPAENDAALILKATPPRASRDLLVRGRLGTAAAYFGGSGGIVLQAPAGFGKSSLLAQWRREYLTRGAVVAWLTLDGNDDVPRFCRGLTLALHNANTKTRHLPTCDGDTELDRLTHWLASIVETAAEAVLILDDAEYLPLATTKHSLLYVLRNAPANLRIIVASRCPLNLPMSDLVAHGQLTILTSEALRFTLDETLALLSARFGSGVTTDDCTRLHDITEGWPLGLQLAIAALGRQTKALTEAIRNISARTADIERYFVECLVSQLTPELAEFLVRIAVVDLVHPDLCRALSGVEQAGALLHELSRSTPILSASAQGEWMRIHPLAKQFLHARFEQLPAADRCAVHERAMQWLSANAMYEEAARHALQIGQHTAAWDLIEHSLYDLLASGHRERVLGWLDRLPPAEIERRPRLRLAAAFALAVGEHHAAARRLVGYILEDPQAPLLDRFDSAMVCASADFYADDIDGAAAIMSPWIDAPPTDNPQSLAMLANRAATIALYGGAPARARYHLERAPTYSDPPRIDYVRGYGEWVRGFSHLWEGQPALAASVLRAAEQRADEDIGRRSPVGVMLASALAAALWDGNQLQQAETVIAYRLDVIERTGPPDCVIMAYVCSARIALARGNERGAIGLLESLCALGEARSIPRLCVMSLVEQIRVHAWHGRPDTCTSLLNRLANVLATFGVEQRRFLGPLVTMAAQLAAAYVAIAHRNWDGALPILDDARARAECLRRGRERIETMLLKALALRESGRDGEPLLAEALSVARSYGLDRIAADTHPALAAWAAQVAPVPENRPQEQLASSRSAQARGGIGVLTPKEDATLRLLACNLSNKQIARALQVGDETVKWHLKNLFRKLNVGRRAHLVARARVLGLLEDP
jgi:LuxR family transcriptional regulator, maltose regulon positive regulatory protein